MSGGHKGCLLPLTRVRRSASHDENRSGVGIGLRHEHKTNDRLAGRISLELEFARSDLHATSAGEEENSLQLVLDRACFEAGDQGDEALLEHGCVVKSNLEVTVLLGETPDLSAVGLIHVFEALDFREAHVESRHLHVDPVRAATFEPHQAAAYEKQDTTKNHQCRFVHGALQFRTFKPKPFAQERCLKSTTKSSFCQWSKDGNLGANTRRLKPAPTALCPVLSIFIPILTIRFSKPCQRSKI